MVLLCGIVLLISSMYANGATLGAKQETASFLEPSIQVEVIIGGFGISAVIRNEGEDNLTEISWKIILDGGLVILGKQAEGTISLLRPNKSETIQVPFLFGFGKTSIVVTVNASEGQITEKTSGARLMGVFVRIIPGDNGALTARLDLVASGLKAPTMLTSACDGTNRLFVADQPGKIYVIDEGVLWLTPFLDLTSKIVKVNPIYDERNEGHPYM